MPLASSTPPFPYELIEIYWERERQLFWRKTFPPIPKPASTENTEKTRGPLRGKEPLERAGWICLCNAGQRNATAPPGLVGLLADERRQLDFLFLEDELFAAGIMRRLFGELIAIPQERGHNALLIRKVADRTGHTHTRHRVLLGKGLLLVIQPGMGRLRRLLSRMDWLVESLLKMSKLDAGTIPFQRMPLSAAELVRRAAAPLAVPMEVRGEHLETDVGGEMLLCDPGWTVEALGNVLKNCMEHAQSVVRVGARETALYTEITVRDDGPGMDPDDIPHLFERFYRGKNANQESFGIGLALSRAILAAQNGTIRAENAREGGALFTLRVYKGVV